MGFFGPFLGFLGYTVSRIEHDDRSGHDLTVNKPGLAEHEFDVYEPGLHHVAFNVQRHAQVDELHRLVKGLGAEILDGPGEFPFGPGGYYAFYFRGPDRLKFEVVHMPLAERAAEARGLLARSL